MKSKKKFAIIVSNTVRSVIYLKALIEENLIPDELIFLDNNKKYHRIKIPSNIKSSNVYVYKTSTINNNFVSNKILQLKSKNIIFSSYGGDIVRNIKILNDKNLIHCHPGKLPNFRGSAVYYYSIIKFSKVFYTTFILNKNIDDGRICTINEYKDFKTLGISELADANERIRNIIIFLKNNLIVKKKINIKKNIINKNNIYYIPHPLIRYFANKIVRNEK